jgi:hypothetical protein
MSLAEFEETADRQLARGNPGPSLGRTKSGREYQKPSGDNEAPEASGAEQETDETVEELTDVDKPSKERQKVLPVDCTALAWESKTAAAPHDQYAHPLCLLLCTDELMNWSAGRLQYALSSSDTIAEPLSATNSMPRMSQP